METAKKLLKNKWTYVILLAAVALASGGVYADQVTQMILQLIGGGSP